MTSRPSNAVPEAPLELALTGEIDLFSVDRVERDLLLALRDRRPSSVVIDMSAVTFIDLAALRLLVSATRAIEEVVLVAPPAMAVRVLGLAGLDHLVTVRPAEAAA